MKRILIALAVLFAALEAAAQYIPPVSDPKLVAIVCKHCGVINVEKGETHRSDCPYANGGEETSSSSSYGGGSHYTFEERHEDAWEARQAAKKAKKAEKQAQKYARPKKVKLKDYNPMAGKTVVAGYGATASTQVVAKYNRKGVPTYGLRSKNGKNWVKKPQFEAITIVGPAVAAAKKKGKVGLLDPNTGAPITDNDYDHFKAFYYPDVAKNTLVALRKTGTDEWHLMKADENGTYTEGMVCSAAEFFEDGTGRKITYRRSDTDKVGLLNEQGGEILPPVFDGLSYLNYTVDGASYYQARMVQPDGQSVRGVIDETGRVVVPCLYDKVDARSWGKYGIKVERDGKVGMFDINGNQLFPDSFESLELSQFWDDSGQKAYFRGWVKDGDGKSWCALFDTHGNRLTDFSDAFVPDYKIEESDRKNLEPYSIY